MLANLLLTSAILTPSKMFSREPKLNVLSFLFVSPVLSPEVSIDLVLLVLFALGLGALGGGGLILVKKGEKEEKR